MWLQRLEHPTTGSNMPSQMALLGYVCTAASM